jgi:CubicO group peptidase (beta-lactamase class C family)
MTISDVLDWDKATGALARQAPLWKSGTKIAYHAMTYGPLLGEVVRRITGKSLKQFFAEEVAGALGADYHIGAPPEADHRVSLLIQTHRRDHAQDSGTIAWRRADLGGSNGHGNAHSAALVQSVVACGGEVNGVRLLSERGVQRALRIESDGFDQIITVPVRWGLGYMLEGPLLNQAYDGRFAGHRLLVWGGSGGRVAFNDLDLRMTVAFVMNRHVEGLYDRRGTEMVLAAYDSLKVPA